MASLRAIFAANPELEEEYYKGTKWAVETVVGLTDNRPHKERKFDGKPRRWCSKCPFPEGCVTCCLD